MRPWPAITLSSASTSTGTLKPNVSILLAICRIGLELRDPPVLDRYSGENASIEIRIRGGFYARYSQTLNGRAVIAPIRRFGELRSQNQPNRPLSFLAAEFDRFLLGHGRRSATLFLPMLRCQLLPQRPQPRPCNPSRILLFGCLPIGFAGSGLVRRHQLLNALLIPRA